MHVRAVSLAGVVALAVASCGSDPTFTEVQTTVFDKSCVFSACHKGASPAGEMNLELDAYDDIVNVPSVQSPDRVRVKPGDPEGSYLISKLLDMPVMGTDEMPPGAPLSEDRIDLVRGWIEAGALDD